MMMKKNIFAAGTALAIGAVSMMGVLPAFGAEITADQAEKTAMEHAGVKESDVVRIWTEKDYEDGRLVYEVEFYTEDYREYDYEISAADGTVVSYDYDAEYWKVQEEWEGEAVDLEGAKAAALADAGLKEEEVSFLKTEWDRDDGRETFEIEFYTASGVEYDYEIDAGTGRVISCDYDAEYDGIKTQNLQKTGSSEGEITKDEAKDIALKAAGISEEEASRIRVYQDRDDGRIVYEGSFIAGEWEYEFEISGSDGRILDWERESIYD